MKKVYYLSSCTTCKRILDELNLPENFKRQDIKTNPLSAKELEYLNELAGSYEALFSKRAQLYRNKGLHEKSLTEDDFKKLILEHYTFLKRPVVVIENKIFVGNAQKIVDTIKKELE
ncbi:arsenate reductase [Gangjinia marincola]|uniref:Arsenate reductase n=1 Tax=Gangjinia marincola TaxID=578463 RepID=A0ABP3XYQ7_9FLAO